MLSCERFRFHLKITGNMVLPVYKGAVFRGAFGNTLKRIVCPTPRNTCNKCGLREKCLYLAVFDPSPPDDFADAGKFNSAPPPYVLTPPLTRRQSFQAKETLSFDLVLMGRMVDALPYMVYTFTEIGRRGLGRRRGDFEISSVALLWEGQVTQVYDGESQIFFGPDFGKSG